MRPVLCLLLLLCAPLARATDLQRIEQDLLRHLDRIRYWGCYQGNIPSPTDSLRQANERFQRQLLHYAATEPATLTADFRRLQTRHFRVATAPDQRLRLYCWDTYHASVWGGADHVPSADTLTWRGVDNVYQFRAGTGVTARGTIPLGGRILIPMRNYQAVFAVSGPRQTYYLAYSTGLHDGTDCHQLLEGFTIDAGQLVVSRTLFCDAGTQTASSGHCLHYLFCRCVCASPAGRPAEPFRLITYDPATRRLRLAVVEQHQLTGQHRNYQFNGSVFTRVE